MKFKALAIAAVIGSTFFLAGCPDDADVASRNISKAAQNFEIQRRIVFVNGITDTIFLTMEGRCSTRKDVKEREIEVTCAVGPGKAIRNTMGISDNVTYVVEQMDPAAVSFYHYRRTFKPQAIIPDIDFRFNGSEIVTNSSEAMQKN